MDKATIQQLEEEIRNLKAINKLDVKDKIKYRLAATASYRDICMILGVLKDMRYKWDCRNPEESQVAMEYSQQAIDDLETIETLLTEVFRKLEAVNV